MLGKLYRKFKNTRYDSAFPFTPSSNKHKIIFIHIPKAAGTAVRIALGEPKTGRRHLPWWVYQQASPRKFDEYFKFSFVRHPISRVLSGYNYMKSGGNKMGDLLVAEQLKKYDSLSEFLEVELLQGSMLYHPVFRPQSWYLCDWNGEIKVDHLGRFESIDKDFREIAKNSGIEWTDDLPKVNKSSTLVSEVTQEEKEMILKAYKDDFLLLGYS